jgi:high-affinity nickel-transport protein
MPSGTILLVGLLLGMRHATDADHVVAIGTLVRREAGMRGALVQGALWGIGHTLTILAVGAAIVLGGVVVPPRAAEWMELGVAVMLIVLGISSVRARVDAPHPSPRRVRPVVIGVVHGLAGSAGLALLALTTIQDKGAALVYLGLFGFGTIVGMMMISAALVAPFAFAAERFERFYRIGLQCAAVASIGLGIVIGGRVLLGY